MRNGTGEKWGSRASEIGLILAFCGVFSSLTAELCTLNHPLGVQFARVVICTGLVTQFLMPSCLRLLGCWVDRRHAARQARKAEQDALTHGRIQRLADGHEEAPTGRS